MILSDEYFSHIFMEGVKSKGIIKLTIRGELSLDELKKRLSEVE